MAKALDIWLSPQEIADAALPDMPNTKRGVATLVERNGWAECARQREGRGGGLEYPLSLLPAAAQRVLLSARHGGDLSGKAEAVEEVYAYRAAGRGKAWAVAEVARLQEVSESSLWRWLKSVEGMDAQARAAAFAPAPHEAVGAALAVASHADRDHAVREAGLAAYNALAPRQQELAMARAQILRAVGELAATTSLSLKGARESFSEGWNAGEDDLGLDAETRAIVPRVSASSLKRWDADFRKGGLAALAPKQGVARKGKGIIDTDEGIRLLIEAMMLDNPDCSAAQVVDALEARVKDRKLPSARSIQRWMVGWKEINSALHLMARSPDKFRSRARLVIGDASEHVVRLNQLWEMDSTPGDILLNDGKRYSVIGCIDVWSRRVKLIVARSSNAVAVAACMRASILDWGVPEVIKTDNGSDYISKHIRGVCTALEVVQDVCPPFSPEKKPHIERVFGTFSRGIIEFIPGFVGHNVTQRKDIEDRKAFAERITKGITTRGAAPVELRMTPEEMQSFCDDWTDAFYGMKEHSSIKTSPYAKAKSWTGAVRRIEDERALDTLMYRIPGDDGMRNVTKRGIQYEHFFYTDPSLQNRLGHRVQVRIDEGNWGRLLILSEGGEFVCWALCPERLGVSRGEAAAHFQKERRGYEVEMRKIIRDKMRVAKVDTIAADVRQDKVEKAAKVLSFPERSTETPYTTPALEEAGKAAAVKDIPRHEQRRTDVSVADVARLSEARRPAPRKAEEPKDRFLRWEAVDDRVTAGEEVGEAEARMWRSYQNTPEYEAVVAMIEISSRAIVLGKEHAARAAG